jgi:hypothetical protein
LKSKILLGCPIFIAFGKHFSTKMNYGLKVLNNQFLIILKNRFLHASSEAGVGLGQKLQFGLSLTHQEVDELIIRVLIQ